MIRMPSHDLLCSWSVFCAVAVSFVSHDGPVNVASTDMKTKFPQMETSPWPPAHASVPSSFRYGAPGVILKMPMP